MIDRYKRSREIQQRRERRWAEEDREAQR